MFTFQINLESVMQIPQVIDRFKKEYSIDVKVETLLFYDRINLVAVSKNDRQRNYSEKDYVKLSKAILLSKEFNMPLEDIDKLLNKHDSTFKDAFLKRKTRLLRILKETL